MCALVLQNENGEVYLDPEWAVGGHCSVKCPHSRSAQDAIFERGIPAVKQRRKRGSESESSFLGGGKGGMGGRAKKGVCDSVE